MRRCSHSTRDDGGRASMRLVLPLLFSLAASSCGGSGPDATGGGPEAVALMREISDGDESWRAVVEAAKAEGEVQVRSVFVEAVEVDLFRRFEEATGIRVNYSRKGGSAPTLQGYLTEVAAGAHLADVIQIESSIAASMPADERMAEFTVPNESRYTPRYQERIPGAHPMAALVVPIVYNRNLITEGELPETYEGLADPAYASRIAMGSPENSSNVVGLVFIWERMFGMSWLRRFTANLPLETDREVEAANFIARGERLLGPISQTSPAAQIQAGAPLSYHWVKGTKVDTYMAIVPELAPHPNAARLFVNFLLSQSHQGRFAREMKAFPVVSGVSPPEGFPELEELEPVSIDAETFNENRERIIQLWRSLPR